MISELEIRNFLDFNLGISKDFRGTKCKIDLKLATDFHHKIILTGYTLYYIFYPRPNDIFENLSKRAVTFDIPSAYSLLRVIYEAYVNCFYILFSSELQSEKDYKIIRWDIHELQERLNLLEIIKSSNQQISTLKSELNALVISLKTNDHFVKFNKRTQNDILKSNKWCKKNINKKAEYTALNKTISEYLYKHTSNFIHSEPLSIAQLHSATTLDEINILLEVPKKILIMFSALSLDILMSLSDDIKNKVIANNDARNQVILYKKLSRLKFDSIESIANTGI